jgi:hypothetical protein
MRSYKDIFFIKVRNIGRKDFSSSGKHDNKLLYNVYVLPTKVFECNASEYTGIAVDKPMKGFSCHVSKKQVIRQ